MKFLRLLTPAEVCELLKIDRRALYRMVERGDLRRIEIGTREYRYLESDVARMLVNKNPHLTGLGDDEMVEVL